MINIKGYDLLGNDTPEGIRFAWGGTRFGKLIESAAFNTRTKLGGEPICAYTTSVSAGCILHSQGCPCIFCRTGKVLPFGGLLTYKEIAKQNIFMVLADMHCDDHPALAGRPREFAYMGQGEPGYSYSQVRMAIELTNRAMKELGQTVYRHIVATCGVPETIQLFKSDIQNYYTERVTLHLSLHAAEQRSYLLPINEIYPLQDIIREADDIESITKEKTCVGIMLFWNFSPKGSNQTYSNTVENVLPLLDMLNPSAYRLSFCEYNITPDVAVAETYPECEKKKLMQAVQDRHFEAKFFSSFGQQEMTACGLLGGKQPDNYASEKWCSLDCMAENLIEKLYLKA